MEQQTVKTWDCWKDRPRAPTSSPCGYLDRVEDQKCYGCADNTNVVAFPGTRRPPDSKGAQVDSPGREQGKSIAIIAVLMIAAAAAISLIVTLVVAGAIRVLTGGVGG